MLGDLVHRFTQIAVQAFETISPQGPEAGFCVFVTMAFALLLLLQPKLTSFLFDRAGPVEVLGVQTIIRQGHNGNRHREVVFKIINGTKNSINVVEVVVTIFGLDGALVLSQEHKLCNVPEGIQPISTKLVRKGEGFQIPAYVEAERVEVKIKNWR